jgi:hypothetical protein
MDQSGGAFHLTNDWIERAVRVLGGAKIAQASVSFRAEAFQKRSRESGFPDPSLTGDQHHLAFAGFCSGPAPKQQFGLFLTSDEGGQARRAQCLEAALDGTRTQRPPRPRPLCDALEVLGL